MKTLPPPETIVHNLILALTKLVEGTLVCSEFYDRRGAPDSYFEGRVAEVLSILSVRQPQAPSESTIDQKICLDYEILFEAERRYFSWDFSLEGRLPARSEWQWEDDEDNSYFFRVILSAEISFGNHEVALLKTISAAIGDLLLAHVAPLGWEHITFNGDYVWPAEPNQQDFRPLRNPRATYLDAA